MESTKTLTQGDLEQFRGSENWYQHALVRGVTFTDGAKYLADSAGAYWLLDIIALSQFKPRVRREEFQVWKLEVKKSRGVVTCADGNNNVVLRQRIQFTDFPMDSVKIYFANGVIHLPSEY